MNATKNGPETEKGKIVVVAHGAFRGGGLLLETLLPGIAADFTARFEAMQGHSVAVRWPAVETAEEGIRARRMARAFCMIEGEGGDAESGDWTERIDVVGRESTAALADGADGIPARRTVRLGDLRGWADGLTGPLWKVAKDWGIRSRAWLSQLGPEVFRWALAEQLDGGEHDPVLVTGNILENVRRDLSHVLEFIPIWKSLAGPKFEGRLAPLEAVDREQLDAIRAREPAIAQAYREGRFARVIGEFRDAYREWLVHNRRRFETTDLVDRENRRRLLCAYLHAWRMFGIFLGPVFPRLPELIGEAFDEWPVSWKDLDTVREEGVLRVKPLVGERDFLDRINPESFTEAAHESMNERSRE